MTAEKSAELCSALDAERAGDGPDYYMFAPCPTPDIDLAAGHITTLPEPGRSLREEHAHMLVVAAARRRRAVERMSVQRHEDANYWKSVAPSALGKARRLREHPSFQPLPD